VALSVTVTQSVAHSAAPQVEVDPIVHQLHPSLFVHAASSVADSLQVQAASPHVDASPTHHKQVLASIPLQLALVSVTVLHIAGQVSTATQLGALSAPVSEHHLQPVFVSGTHSASTVTSVQVHLAPSVQAPPQ
jgi:hypothetical protein